MNKAIKDKIEIKKHEIKSESERLRKIGKEIHKCPNCSKDVDINRLYCSDKCSAEFYYKYDYSKNSEILKEYKKELQEEYENKNPKKEMNSMTYPISRKNYKCDFCNTIIQKNEKYCKYTILPGDEEFIDYPYENYRYHLNCKNFITTLANIGILDYDGYGEEGIEAILESIAIEQNKSYEETIKDIISGNFPSEDFLNKLWTKYEDFTPTTLYEDFDFSFFEKDYNHKYIYSVEYRATGITRSEIYFSYYKIKEPQEFFKKYFIEELFGEDFDKILSIKSLEVEVELKENNCEVEQ